MQATPVIARVSKDEAVMLRNSGLMVRDARLRLAPHHEDKLLRKRLSGWTHCSRHTTRHHRAWPGQDERRTQPGCHCERSEAIQSRCDARQRTGLLRSFRSSQWRRFNLPAPAHSV